MGGGGGRLTCDRAPLGGVPAEGMDDARKLLDSLMGQTRDQSLDEATKTRGKNFMQDSVCKSYLLGFCPESELSESKMLVKRNIRMCNKVHSDAMKSEYEAHPDVRKHKAEYEKQLLPVLEGLVREADAWVAREQANVQKADGPPERVTTNNMAPSVKETYEQLKDDMNKMMAAAETEAEKGNVEGSKFKVTLANEIKSKIQELEEKHLVTYTVTHRGEDVCEVCGTRYEALTSTNHARHAAHFTGKVHLAYVKIRDWVKSLRERRRDEDGQREGSPEERAHRSSRRHGRDRGRSRSRRRSRDGEAARRRS